jgi:hypothetical protein
LVRLKYLRSSIPLSCTLALLACAGQSPSQQNNFSSLGPSPISLPGTGQAASAPPGPPGAAPLTGKTSGNIAFLVPLTGNLAPVGQILENAAKLAFPDNSSPTLDIRDTGGTAAGAAAAAQAAIAAGDGLILGPLTSAETQAVAPIAQAANINVLAFTNDGAVASSWVWPLGITPTQQAQRAVQAAANGGHTQLAALLSDDDFGHHLAQAITAEATTLSEPNPNIAFYPVDSSTGQADFNQLGQTINSLSDFADRGQAIEDQIKAANALGTAAGREKARELQHQQIPPPPFNALFLSAYDPNTLAEITTFLPYYAVNPPQVQLLGPANWAGVAAKLSANPVLNGALYAAADPASAAAFDAKYQSTYGAAPPPIADVAFDAAAIAKLAAGNGGYTNTVLNTPSGFTGTDGVLVLAPSGQVLRALAVFQIAPGGPVITSPAPTTISPSS